MSLPCTLAAFALRYALGDSTEKVVSALGRHFTDHSQALPRALVRANEKAWKGIGLALAGDSLFDRVKDLIRGGDVTGLRDEIRAFLARTPTGLEATAAEVRARACDEFGRLRKSGRLALQIDRDTIANDVRRYGDPTKLVADTERAVAAVADVLAPDAPHLASVLRLAPPGGTPLLACAFLYFFRREVETNEALFRALTFDSLRALTAEQERGFELLAGRTAGILDQFDLLFDTLGDWFAAADRKQDEILAQIKLLATRGVTNPLGVSVTNETELHLLRQLRNELRELPPELLTLDAWTGLANALRKFGAAAEAGEAHETAAAAANTTRDTAAEAANHYEAYLDACEAGDWTRAAERLWKAVALEPIRYRPFDHWRYKPVRILGGGAFGTVFHCLDEYDRDDEGRPRPVAIKSFRTELLDRDLAEVFKEANTLMALGHESIIRVLNRGFGDSQARRHPYLVLDYFPGQMLDQVSPLPLPDFFVIARKVAAAVHAAHTRAQPIYHRDLKPSNVMVQRHTDGSWTVKIIDFGLAVRADVAKAGMSVPAATYSTRSASVAGTLKYAPPEQTGELPGVPVGAYSDVFAFGKTCLNMLFRTTDPKSWDWKPLPDAIRRPLRELFERCTAESLEYRFPNFEPVLKGLAELDAVEQTKREQVARVAATRVEKRGRDDSERREAAQVSREHQIDTTAAVPSVPHVLLLGRRGAGKSALLGALLQASATQGETLGGEVVHSSPDLMRLRDAVYSGTKIEPNTRELVSYTVRLRLWRAATRPIGEPLEVIIDDCDGKAAESLLEHPEPITQRAPDSPVARAVVGADAIVLLVDAASNDEELAEAFEEFDTFLTVFGRAKTDARAVGGFPVFLVLTQCDRLARPGDTPNVWEARVKAQTGYAWKAFGAFLKDADPDDGMRSPLLPLGSIELTVCAIAVRRPPLPGSTAPTHHPYQVAELFRDCFAEARAYCANRRFREGETASTARTRSNRAEATG